MKAKPIEIIKNVLIVLLTLSAVYLVCVNWGNMDIRSLLEKKETVDLPEQTADALKTQEVIKPLQEGIWIGDEFRETETWPTFLESLRSLGETSGANAQELTEAKIYMQKECWYLYIKFAEGLPFEGFCKQFGIASANFGNVSNLAELRYYAEDSGAIYLLEEKSRRIYRLGVSNEACANLRKMISQEETAFPIIEKKPHFYESTLAFTDENIRENEVDSFAKGFFGDGFDFVRRVEDSQGTLTYMYGYNKKVLTVTKSGSIEYKEELEPAEIAQGFYASLGTALQFATLHGGWYDYASPVLAKAESITNEHRQGYRFTMDFRIGEETLPNTWRITAEVYDGQVTYYKRNIITAMNRTEETGKE